MRFIFAILVGAGIGYFAGFKDGRENERNVVQRFVDKTGAKSGERAKAAETVVDSVSKP